MKTTRKNVIVTDRNGKSAAAVLVTKASAARRGWKAESELLIDGVKQVWAKADTTSQAVKFLCTKFKLQITE